MATPFKMVSESIRERETFKYDPSLYVDCRYQVDGQLPPTKDLKTSSDSVLTGLIQLGAFQTGAERSFLSLFDTTHQFVIAEAVPMTPLTPSLPSQDCPSPLLLCGFAIPRSNGTCDHVLQLGDTTPSTSRDLPVSLVPNLEEDDRFKRRPYCQFGGQGQFYAGIPIRTRRGINIGTYCVMSSKKPEKWNDSSATCLSDISHAIMAHLEANRSKASHRRAERMNRGIGSFVEGKSTLSGWHSGSHPAAFTDGASLEGDLDPTQQILEHNGHSHLKGALHSGLIAQQDLVGTLPGLAPVPGNPVQNSIPSSPLTSEQPRTKPTSTDFAPIPGNTGSTPQSDTDIVFAKAANIIREACEVAGCLFFDVTTGSYKIPANRTLSEKDEAGSSTDHRSSASGSDDGLRAQHADPLDAMCSLIGFSTWTASSINGKALSCGEELMPAHFLAKLLKRYPAGKIFSFDSVGELHSSDASEEDVLRAATEGLSSNGTEGAFNSEVNVSTAARRRQARRLFSRVKEGSVIQKMFPSARSVAFVPIWNSKLERWVAGGFVYTLNPTRVFTVEGELSFLKAFGRLIVAEVQTRDIQQSDKAKSDALGSLSHELRSPLHGAILGTELLNDTDLNVFQSSAAYTIETCCRTLLDTIDHLLDYSKVNSFASTRNQEVKTEASRPRTSMRADRVRKKTLRSDVRLDGVIEEVVESMFAGHNFQHMSVQQAAKQHGSAGIHSTHHGKLDLTSAVEQLRPDLSGEGEDDMQAGLVSLSLHFDSKRSWMFNVHVGAIRRIIMNIVGNSLKYTTRGTIHVSLTQEASRGKGRKTVRLVKLQVQDTGKGIGEEYLHHRMFKPFAQEDELAPGTGLGLSIVKKIVSQLNGQISVQSSVGVGTLTTVTLPLEPSASQISNLRREDQEFLEHLKDLKGLRLALAGFNSERTASESIDERTLIEDICRNSLGLELVSDKDERHFVPDIILSGGSLPDDFQASIQLSKAPHVIVCEDALAAYARLTEYERGERANIVEFISQPLGPRKLARSLQLAYNRWTGLPKHYMAPSRIPAPSRTLTPSGIRTPINVGAVQTSLETGTTSQEPTKMMDILPPAKASRRDAPSGPPDRSAPTLDSQIDVQARFLLVDDNPINLKVLSAFMSKLGYAYERATNGKEAVEAYTRAPSCFLCIFMDISMPIMDGFEATRLVRDHEQEKKIPPVPVVALTGLASADAYKQASASGVNIFVTKPATLKTLKEALQSLAITDDPPSGLPLRTLPG